MRLPVLMTASVSTRGMKGACFDDATREAMYLESMRFYLKTIPEYQIVFAENSGWDLAEMAKKIPEAAGRVEWIALDPNDFDISKGKGYNESILMSLAVGKSMAIRESGAFMKVTGRYPIFNLKHYLKKAERLIFEKGGKFYGDIKDHKVFDLLFPNNTKKWNGHAAYTVLFACTNDFYTAELGPRYVECNDYTDDWIENVWFRVLKPYRGQRKSGVSLRFDIEPVCGGMQGSTAQTIAFSQSNRSFKARVALFVGNCIRIFTPWFWF